MLGPDLAAVPTPPKQPTQAWDQDWQHPMARNGLQKSCPYQLVEARGSNIDKRVKHQKLD